MPYLLLELVGESKSLKTQALGEQYEELLLGALKLRTTMKKNTNVIQHLMGYFKKQRPAAVPPSTWSIP